MNYRNNCSIAFLFSCFVVIMAGCNDTELQSTWRDREIVIDGSDAEWQGNSYLFQKTKTTLGMCNDEHYMYLCLVVSDRQTERQMTGRGSRSGSTQKGEATKHSGFIFR